MNNESTMLLVLNSNQRQTNFSLRSAAICILVKFLATKIIDVSREKSVLLLSTPLDIQIRILRNAGILFCKALKSFSTEKIKLLILINFAEISFGDFDLPLSSPRNSTQYPTLRHCLFYSGCQFEI